MQILLLNKFRISILLIIFFYFISFSAKSIEYSVVENRLFMTGQAPSNDEEVENFFKILEDTPQINTIVFENVWGGSHYDGMDIADLIIDFELDTHTIGYCEDACTFMFVAGEKRTLERGSKITMHIYPYTFEQVQRILKEKSYEYIGSLEEYIIWLDNTARAELIQYFSLFLERGVKPSFIIESLNKSNGVDWTPRRKQLLEARYITE